MYKIYSIKIFVNTCLRALCVMIPRLHDTSYEGQVDRWFRSTRLGNSKHTCMLDFPHIMW